MAHKELYLYKNNKFDNKSLYNINANRYLDGIFSNKYNSQNGYNINNNICQKKSYNTQTFKPHKDSNNKNMYKYGSSSSNLNTNTNATINEKLTGSTISISKNNEKN